jgi:restriction endonuclease S subunit
MRIEETKRKLAQLEQEKEKEYIEILPENVNFLEFMQGALDRDEDKPED